MGGYGDERPFRMHCGFVSGDCLFLALLKDLFGMFFFFFFGGGSRLLKQIQAFFTIIK